MSDFKQVSQSALIKELVKMKGHVRVVFAIKNPSLSISNVIEFCVEDSVVSNGKRLNKGLMANFSFAFIEGVFVRVDQL